MKICMFVALVPSYEDTMGQADSQNIGVSAGIALLLPVCVTADRGWNEASSL